MLQKLCTTKQDSIVKWSWYFPFVICSLFIYELSAALKDRKGRREYGKTRKVNIKQPFVNCVSEAEIVL
jgi:hypothetical protein